MTAAQNQREEALNDGRITVTLRDRTFYVIADRKLLPFDVIEFLDQAQAGIGGQGELAKALLGQDQWDEMKNMSPKPSLADLESILNQAMDFLGKSESPSDSSTDTATT